MKTGVVVVDAIKWGTSFMLIFFWTQTSENVTTFIQQIGERITIITIVDFQNIQNINLRSTKKNATIVANGKVNSDWPPAGQGNVTLCKQAADDSADVSGARLLAGSRAKLQFNST